MRAFLSAAIWLTEIYAGPCDILMWQPILCLMGQCVLIVKKPILHEWAHAMAVEDALVQHMLPSRYGGALPNLW